MTLQNPLEEEVENVSLWFNKETVKAYHLGTSDESYESLIENIVSKLVIFSSYGGRWQLLSIDTVTLKLFRCVAVRGSSYNTFHEGHPLRKDSNFLDLHNGSNDNCFLFCYGTGYHKVYKKKKNWSRQHRASGPGRIFLHTAERTRQPRCRKATSKFHWVFMTYQSPRISMKCKSMFSSNKIFVLPHFFLQKINFSKKENTQILWKTSII